MNSNVSTSNFAKITPQINVAVGSGFSLNGLLLTKNTDFPLGVPLSFNSDSAVGAYAGLTSAEYAFAGKYFAANDNKTKLPAALLAVGYSLAPTAGWVRGAAIEYTMAQLKTITNGVLKLSFGGSDIELTGLDLSATETFSQIAQALQTKLRAAGAGQAFTSSTVEYNSNFGAFVIKSGATDDTGAVGYAVASTSAGTDLSSVLKLTELDGAIISPVQTETISLSAFMDNILKQTQGWFSFCKLWTLSDAAQHQAEDLEFATWCGLQGVRYAYIEHDQASADTNPSIKTDFASKLAGLGIGGTSPCYGTTEHCAFVMGTVAATNYEVRNGRITVAFKTQSGLTPTCTNNDDYLALSGKGYNSYVRDGSAANTFFGWQRGTISGKYQFLDAYANHVWLNDQLQVAIRTVLGDVNALPYNNFGYNRILNAITPVVSTALNAGVINPQIDLDDAQITAIASETGWTPADVKNTLYQNGWAFQAISPTAAVRANRGTPVLRFYYCDGGAIQKIDLISTVVR